MSYDSVAALSRFAKRRNLRFTLLSDPGSEIIRAFGLLDERHAPGTPFYGIAHPMIFVVGPDGVIMSRFSEIDYTRRPDPEAVLRTLRQR